MDLLAVDLGVKTGLAFWTSEGHLKWYRSQNYGSKERLGRAVFQVLHSVEQPAMLVLEGGGRLADLWADIAQRTGWPTEVLHAEEWRSHLINQSELNSATSLKDISVYYAKRAAVWGRHPVAGKLNHNTAEAILAGLWVLIKNGFSGNLPWLLPYTERSK